MSFGRVQRRPQWPVPCDSAFARYALMAHGAVRSSLPSDRGGCGARSPDAAVVPNRELPPPGSVPHSRLRQTIATSDERHELWARATAAAVAGAVRQCIRAVRAGTNGYR
jgi:hypothetical protein